jgi:hypothetical protein
MLNAGMEFPQQSSDSSPAKTKGLGKPYENKRELGCAIGIKLPVDYL